MYLYELFKIKVRDGVMLFEPELIKLFCPV